LGSKAGFGANPARVTPPQAAVAAAATAIHWTDWANAEVLKYWFNLLVVLPLPCRLPENPGAKFAL
jgi:hypothetical protein